MKEEFPKNFPLGEETASGLSRRCSSVWGVCAGEDGPGCPLHIPVCSASSSPPLPQRSAADKCSSKLLLSIMLFAFHFLKNNFVLFLTLLMKKKKNNNFALCLASSGMMLILHFCKLKFANVYEFTTVSCGCQFAASFNVNPHIQNII